MINNVDGHPFIETGCILAVCPKSMAIWPGTSTITVIVQMHVEQLKALGELGKLDPQVALSLSFPFPLKHPLIHRGSGASLLEGLHVDLNCSRNLSFISVVYGQMTNQG